MTKCFGEQFVLETSTAFDEVFDRDFKDMGVVQKAVLGQTCCREIGVFIADLEAAAAVTVARDWKAAAHH